MTKNMWDLDTPALVVDVNIMEKNIKNMQKKADEAGVNLRPHTKTHRTPALAKMQVQAGAKGITVAKVGEAEVMAAAGLDDIFIANEIYGKHKLARLKQVAANVKVCLGVDNQEQVRALGEVFQDEAKPIEVLIEIETGEERSGLIPGPEVVRLAEFITQTPNVKLKGVFSHEGHTYGAGSVEECISLFNKSQEDTLYAADLIRQEGLEIEVISIGATPSLMQGEILPGITEIRPGTYILMDGAQGHAINDYSRCALTVLATVVSKPTPERTVLDTGVKALTAFTRSNGICYTPGFGLVKGFENLRLAKLYDEHGLINNREVNQKLKIGDKVEIIPNHVCPTCNLYDKIHMVQDGKVIVEFPVLGRGRSQ
ncbi:MAG: D-TA family PLP-dependent enzyme [Peptococcaceae bacterium]